MSPTCEVVNVFNKEKFSSIADYYTDKSIFITGGTGFLGKMYIQKILYSCSDVDKIYMLVRAGSKEEAKYRITQMVENSSQLFKQLKEERPVALLKLVPILGDLSKPNLGIHPEDELLLQEKVSIVVHSAATLNMRDLLQDALNINVAGTQNVLALAKRIKRLQAFVHISTTFCALNSENEFIEEIVYPPPTNLDDIRSLQEQYGHMRQPPKHILGEHWNTYTFTKAISENMLHLNHGDLPTAIIRPSLIGSAHMEPFKGWLDVMNLHSFVLYAMSNGQIRTINMDKRAIWDFIPVDYVANLMILAATKCKRSNDVDVYNCASSSINPVKLSDAISIFISDFVKNNTIKIRDCYPKKTDPVIRWIRQLYAFLGSGSNVAGPVIGSVTSNNRQNNRAVEWYFKCVVNACESLDTEEPHSTMLRLHRTANDKIPFPFVLYLKSKKIFDVLTPIVQSTPAHISDISCLFTGQTPNSVKSYRKFMEFKNDITFYGSRSWKIKSDRVISLLGTLNDEDKKTFPCDPIDINWIEYFKKYSEAVRHYTLKFNKKSKL